MPEQLTSEQIAERRRRLKEHNYLSEMAGIEVTEEMKAAMEPLITGKMNGEEFRAYLRKKYMEPPVSNE